MKYQRWLIVLACTIVIEIWASFVSAGDPDLVLHYRFGEDEGDQVTDLSLHGNHGVNKFGQFMEEVRGRRGVMRFDGEKSIVEAKSDSLKLKGDFTYALWVRQNAIEKSANCPLFGGPFYGFSVSAYTNLTFSANSQDAAGDDLAMSWPVDREILGTDWSHLTVVVAYPRIRFYRNGQLIRDAWMPFSLESPREKGNKITLGSTGRYFGFVDLDEVMVFNRALSAADVKDLATGKLPTGNTPSRHPDGAVLV